MKVIIIVILVFTRFSLFAQELPIETKINYSIDEIIVFQDYDFENKKDIQKYEILKEDLMVVYPLLLIVRADYERINKELELYEGDKQKKFLKWYEKYAKTNYLPYLGALNIRQGRLFVKMISRELKTTPYKLIKQYRNGFTATFWQITSHFYFANLNSVYLPEENPMIEHIMQEIERNYS